MHLIVVEVRKHKSLNMWPCIILVIEALSYLLTGLKQEQLYHECDMCMSKHTHELFMISQKGYRGKTSHTISYCTIQFVYRL